MKKRWHILAAAMGLSVVMLTSCGSSSSKSSEASAAMYDSYAMEEMEESTAADDSYAYDYDSGVAMGKSADNSAAEGSGASEEVKPSSRKLITTVNLEAETEELDPLINSIESKVNALGGYIENSSVYTDSPYYGSDARRRRADMTIRIPAARLDDFLSVLDGQASITSRSKNVEDITLNYVDTQAHKDALEAEYDSLMKLMEGAKSIEDIMALETRLTDVRYELESIESRLRTYDNQVDYSTIYINLTEVQTYTPQETSTVGDRISKGLTRSLSSVGRGLVDFFVFFVTHLPQLAVFIIAVLIIIFIVRLIIGAVRKSFAKKKERRERKGRAAAGSISATKEKNELQDNSKTQARYAGYEKNAPEKPEETTEKNMSDERNNS